MRLANNKKFKINALAMVIASTFAATPNLYAAEETEEKALETPKEAGVPVLTVTARRIAENIQSIPISITAISAETIAENGITDVTDIQQYAANTTLQVSRGSSSTLTAYIRGVGQQDPLWGFEPGVGIYIDDVYIARPQGAVMEILDVERIEVLRGPQGTLYGKNTIGGALKYVTRPMEGDAEFKGELTFGNYNQQNIKLAGQLPFADDKFYVGFAIADINRDGFGTFINTGDENYNKDVMSGRLNMEYHASDDLLMRFAYDTTTDDSNAKGGYRLVPSVLTGQLPYDNVFDSDTSLPVYNKVETSGTSLTVDWNIDDELSLKSVTSLREGNTYTNIDFDSTALKSLDVPAIYDDEQLSQEFQLTYLGDGMTAVGGIYYYDGDACGAFDVQLEVLGMIAFGTPFTLENGGCTNTKSQSIYGQTSFDLAEQWSMTLGGRYTSDTKNALVYRHRFLANTYPGALRTGDPTALDPTNWFEGEKTWNHFSPRVGVEYQATDNLMYYASYSNGFKSGGFNMRADISSDPSGNAPFDPEVVDTYEFGFKSDPSNTLRFNATYFFNDYQDMQVTVQRAVTPGNFVARVLNAGQAEAQGIELESIWSASENLTFTTGLGYIDSKFVEFLNEVADPNDPNETIIVDQADQLDISNTPELNVNFGLKYNIETSTGDFLLTANAAYRSETQIFEGPSPLDEDAYTLINMGVTYYHSDDKFSTSLLVKNVTDEKVRIAGYCFATGLCPSASLGLDNTVVGYYGDPRTIALTLAYEF